MSGINPKQIDLPADGDLITRVGGVTTVLGPGAPGQVLTVVAPNVLGYSAGPAAVIDPRDIFRFSMMHNVGVTGGG